MANGQKFRRIVWPMALAQTLLWAGFYYLFPALIAVWEKEFPWSKAELAGALTLALLVSASLAPFAGRRIDRGGGRSLFIAASLAGVVLLALLSQVTHLWQFYLVWGCLGAVMAGTLYEPCFALLTHVMGDRARQAITLVTLVAGFAGTVAFPSLHTLVGLFGWRTAVLTFAAVELLVALPLLFYALSHARTEDTAHADAAAEGAAKGPSVVRTWVFWFLALTSCMMALNHGAIIAHMLPMLAERGVGDEAAVLAASMIGPMQVAGRLASLAAQRHISTAPIAAIALLTMALASAALYGAHSVPALLVLFVLFQGAGNGVMSISRPVIVAELLGRRRYGVIAGMLASFYVGSFALGPGIAGLVWEWSGYDGVLAMTFTAGVVGAVALMTAVRIRAARPLPPET